MYTGTDATMTIDGRTVVLLQANGNPVYGWNLLRRLFRKPLYWEITCTFTTRTKQPIHA